MKLKILFAILIIAFLLTGGLVAFMILNDHKDIAERYDARQGVSWTVPKISPRLDQELFSNRSFNDGIETNTLSVRPLGFWNRVRGNNQPTAIASRTTKDGDAMYNREWVHLGWSPDAQNVYYVDYARAPENNSFGSDTNIVRHSLKDNTDTTILNFYGLLLDAWPEKDRILYEISDRTVGEMRIEYAHLDGTIIKTLYTEAATANHGLGLQSDFLTAFDPVGGSFSPDLKRAYISTISFVPNPAWGKEMLVDLETGKATDIGSRVNLNNGESVVGWKDAQTLQIAKVKAVNDEYNLLDKSSWYDVREVKIN